MITQMFPYGMQQYLIGGLLIGIGWGICGVCPGPALSGVGAGNFDLLIALAGIFTGAWLHGLWANRQPGKAHGAQQLI
jgi:uncharacterized membrane protein YedE/YeeE